MPVFLATVLQVTIEDGVVNFSVLVNLSRSYLHKQHPSVVKFSVNAWLMNVPAALNQKCMAEPQLLIRQAC